MKIDLRFPSGLCSCILQAKSLYKFTNVGIRLVKLNVHGLFQEFYLNLVLSNTWMIENTCSFLNHPYVLKCIEYIFNQNQLHHVFGLLQQQMCHVTNYVDFFFIETKLFPKFQSHELIKHNIYDMWKSKFKTKSFILFSCAL